MGRNLTFPMICAIIDIYFSEGMKKMSNNKSKEKKSKEWTVKQRGTAALISVIIAVIWELVWLSFPLPVYDIYRSVVGANLVYLCLAVMVTFCENFITARFFKTTVSLPASLIVNAIGMPVIITIYSIFRYTAVYVVILSLFLHIAASVFITKKYGHSEKEQSGIGVYILGAMSALISDVVYFAAFSKMLNDFIMMNSIVY